MLHQKITILPPKKEKILISSINNFEAQQGYNLDSRSVKIKNQEEFFISFQIFNQTKFKHIKINYPNLWAEIDILNENLEVVQPKFKIIKEMGVIIKKNKINLKKFNFRLILKDKQGIVDQATIFVV